LNGKVETTKFEAIISVGKTFDIFQDRIKKGQYKKPDNVHIVASAPQLNILRRASLFITHCGQNSVSESINFGVPMVCLPQSLDSDQTFVANRVANELGLGIELESAKFKPSELVRTIETILNDKKYLERVLRLAHLSNHYNGNINGAKEINNIIEQSKKKLN
jgi:UDP:flavonoid glycosyltransferase YjiC (YdhE family)